MKDMLGNEIRVGSLLFWAGTNTVCSVIGQEKDSITIGIRIPVSNNRLAEFVSVVNPAEQQIASDIAKGKSSLVLVGER